MTDTNASYTCKTCGKSSTSKGHLCSPVTQTEKVECGYCGEVENETHHVCAPKVEKLKYNCGSCGRIATSGDELCDPKEIPGAGEAKKGCCQG